MGLVFKIAWRNIWRHKGKSLLIGAFIFLGALLMTVGNGLVSGMEKGLSDNIINLFTGDLVLLSTEQEINDVFFNSSGKPLKLIKNYQAVRRVLKTGHLINSYIPVTAGMVFVFNSGSEMGSMMLLGVDISQYLKFFPNSIKITEGRQLQPGERGLLISEEVRKKAFDNMDFWLLPEGAPLNRAKLPSDAENLATDLEIRRELVFMGASEANTSVDIKVPVKGVYNYRALNKIWDNYGIIDIQSFREAYNYVTVSDEQTKMAQSKRELLESEHLDTLFTSESIFDTEALTSAPITVTEIQNPAEKTKTSFTLDSGAYNLIFLKLKQGQSSKVVQRKLNEAFMAQKLPVKVVGWKEAMGTVGLITMLIKISLNLFIMFVYFVIVIVIMNTLSIAAVERTSEIAVMRAIGARKSILRKMFVNETALITFFFGGLGIIVGCGVIFALRAANFTTDNDILQLVYGGDKLNPVVSLTDLLPGLLELGFVSFLAVLYPLRVIGKIKPLDAIARE